MGEEQNECGCGCSGTENTGCGNTGGNGSDQTLGMLCHLLAFCGLLIPLGSILGPLVLWLVKKDSSPAVAYHGKESLNFQISMFIYGLICGVLLIILIGYVLLPILFVFWAIMTIIACIKASNGIEYRYPFCLRLLK